MRALLSADDKSGLVPFASELHRLGWELVTTGRTQQVLQAAGLPVTAVADLTGSPEMLGGRVKTLHPRIHGGILARRDNTDDLRDVAAYDLPLFDMVVVNLYPFVERLQQAGLPSAERREAIDIGGVALLRAAAKNYEHVLVVSQPSQYEPTLAAIAAGDNPGAAFRRDLALAAFRLTAAYDAAIAAWLGTGTAEQFADRLVLPLQKIQTLRYGENPHQQGAFYRFVGPTEPQLTVAGAEQLNGRDMSFNNLLDLQAAFDAASDFAAPTVVIIKHTNPCGLACHQELVEAYRRAHAGDPLAAYGGVIGCNRTVDEATAREIRPLNYDAIIAPDYEPAALAILKRKKQGQMVVLRCRGTWGPATAIDGLFNLTQLDIKRVSGGLLLQTPDTIADDQIILTPVTKRQPTLEEVTDLIFAFRACKHVKSNCVVIAKHLAIVGSGAGQQSRVLAAEIAVMRAEERAKGAVMATDGFFPFADGVEVGIRAGVTAVIHPGGSIRDAESIAACDQHGVAMLTTGGVRHFRH
ncbi:MAG TPA: bifunctional phosphoribosylaminoimidazolecarboxamide formyltransferase/IMP cyclohydrolase [Chloroflexota bacterium]